MNKRIAVLLLILLAVVGAIKYKEAQDEIARRAREAKQATFQTPKVVRDWRWATEPEWVVHQVVRLIASWSLAEGSDAPTISVHRKPDTTPIGAFEVSLTGKGARSFLVAPSVHIWDPGGYSELAAGLLGPGPVASDPARPDVAALLLESDAASLVKADHLIFDALSAHPRSASLHEQAALLWAAYAMRNSSSSGTDWRPFVNGITAHLALARALSAGGLPGPDAEIAGVVMDLMVARQIDAMRRIDALSAASADPFSRAWAGALRTRLTHDPRVDPAHPPRTRIEKLEYLNAIRWSRPNCAEVFDAAARWKMSPAADWSRDTVTCVDEAYLAKVGNPLEMQALEGMSLAEVSAATGEEGVAALAAISRANTHQPARPSAIVPVEVRAEAGLRHVAAAYLAVFGGVAAKAYEGAALRFSEWAAPIRTLLPTEALVELAQSEPDREPGRMLENREFVKASADVCDRISKVLTDRPDLLAGNDWQRIQACVWHPMLKSVGRSGWDQIALPGTGLLTVGPWAVGVPEKDPEFEKALERTPWSWYQMAYLLHRRTGARKPTSQELVAAYAPLLEHSTSVMFIVMDDADDPDLVQKLAVRACDIDADKCGTAGAMLAEWDRLDAALPLGARALAKSRSAIGLAKSLNWYVSALQERGRTGEAMRIARRMADVYSAGGLLTLAKAYERMGQFKEAAEVYRLEVERYVHTEYADRFYVRHAQRYGPSPFEEETRLATERLFPKGLRRMAAGDPLPAGRPLSLNNRKLFTIHFQLAGLAYTDDLIAVDGFVVETAEQFHTVLSFSDAPTTTFLVKGADGKVRELTAPFHRSHYDLVSKARTHL